MILNWSIFFFINFTIINDKINLKIIDATTYLSRDSNKSFGFSTCSSNLNILISTLQPSEFHCDLAKFFIYNIKGFVDKIKLIKSDKQISYIDYKDYEEKQDFDLFFVSHLITDQPDVLSSKYKEIKSFNIISFFNHLPNQKEKEEAYEFLNFYDNFNDLNYYNTDHSIKKEIEIKGKLEDLKEKNPFKMKSSLQGIIPEKYYLEYLEDELYLFLLSIEKKIFTIYILKAFQGKYYFIKIHTELLKHQQFLSYYRSSSNSAFNSFIYANKKFVFVNNPSQPIICYVDQGNLVVKEVQNKNIELLNSNGANLFATGKGFVSKCEFPRYYKFTRYGLMRRNDLSLKGNKKRLPSISRGFYIKKGTKDEIELFVNIEKSWERGVEGSIEIGESGETWFKYFLNIRKSDE